METLSSFLKNNINKTNKLLSELKISNQSFSSELLFELIISLGKGSSKIAKIISNPNQKSIEDTIGSQNKDGDKQKKLDLIADEIIEDIASKNRVKWYASEEQEEVLHLDEKGCFSLCVDPLDGSSNIETNAPIGVIFSIYEAFENEKDSILQCGNKQISSGFIIFGPRTIFLLTFGLGTVAFQLNNTDEFVLINKKVIIPMQTSEFSINMSNYKKWNNNIRSYIDVCLEGKYGERKKNYNMRWVGSLVSDAWRIFTRGGIFLYTEDKRLGYEKGRLRLLYEANPISFLVEQANGVATNGVNSILSIKPTNLHERVSFIFGSSEEVKFYLSKTNNK